MARPEPTRTATAPTPHLPRRVRRRTVHGAVLRARVSASLRPCRHERDALRYGRRPTRCGWRHCRFADAGEVTRDGPTRHETATRSHGATATAWRPAGCCSSAACRSAAPTRCSSWLPPSSATASTGCPTARPARGRTGSCGSTRCSARGPSSRCARPATTRTAPFPGCASATASRSTPCASSDLGYAQAAIVVVPHLRPAQARRADPARTAGSRCRCRPRSRRSPRSSRPRTRLASSRSTRRAMMTELAADLRRDPARPARGPVGHQLRVRHARRRHADVVPRPPRPASSSASCGSGAASRPASSSATTSATATSATTRERPLRRPAARRDRQRAVARASAARSTGSTSRCRRDRVDVRFFETLGQLALRPETQLYLGAAPPADGVAGAEGPHRRRAAVRARLRRRHRLRVGPPPRPGRRGARSSCTAAVTRAGWHGRHAAGVVRVARRLVDRVPDETWTHEPVDDFGTAYDNVDRHGWYRNLDPTVEELAHLLSDGDDPDRLLGRHRHPARPAEAAHVRHAGRRRSSSTARPSSCGSRSRSSATTPRSGSGCCAS